MVVPFIKTRKGRFEWKIHFRSVENGVLINIQVKTLSEEDFRQNYRNLYHPNVYKTSRMDTFIKKKHIRATMV